MERSLIFVVLCLLSLSPFPVPADAADDAAVVARLKVMTSPGGQKLFRCQSMGPTKTLLCHAVVQWAEFSPEVHGTGYKLHEASERQIIAPPLPSDCALSEFAGDLTPDSSAPNTLTFQFKGESCIKMGGVILSGGVTFVFRSVPASAGPQVTPEVLVVLAPGPSISGLR